MGNQEGILAYLQLRELLVLTDHMTQQQGVLIPLNVLKQIAELSDDEWSLLLLRYGRETTRHQVITPDKLRSVRDHITTSLEQK